MTENDQKLLSQMIHAGRFNGPIYDLLCEHNKHRSAQKILEMGNKWCCHPDNKVKRLETPLPILQDKQRTSKVLKGLSGWLA